MIIYKNNDEIALMKKAGKIVGETLLLLEKEVKPGVTTAELDMMAEEFITKHGAKPSFKGLYGFPSSLCISVNEQVIHGFPGVYVLSEFLPFASFGSCNSLFPSLATDAQAAAYRQVDALHGVVARNVWSD